MKLYFMLGLPTETDEDVLGIADLANKVYHVWRKNTPNQAPGRADHGVHLLLCAQAPHPLPVGGAEYPGGVSATGDLAPGEPAQTNPSPTTGTIRRPVSWRPSSPGGTVGWPMSSRRPGATGPSSTPGASISPSRRWMDAFAACGVDPTFYANRLRDREEVFPWTVISDRGYGRSSSGGSGNRLTAGEITPDCREQCSGCGANRLCEGGICHA